MNELKKQIKEKKFNSLYLFYGEENYLKRHYTDEIINAVLPESDRVMNLDIFDDKTYSADKLSDKCDTMPFMAERRIIVIKNSGIFAPGKKDESEKTFDYLPHIPEDCIVIFAEDKIDKRSRLFKKAGTTGKSVEFKTPSESIMIKWIAKKAKEYGADISMSTGAYLLNVLKSGMETVDLELSKLSDYAKGREIQRSDIDLIVTKPLESRVFDMIRAVTKRNTEEALYMYNSMLLLKESPIGILTLMSRQYKNMLSVKELAMQRKSPSEISSVIGLNIWAVNDCIKNCGAYTFDMLEKGYTDCLETDVRIKSGKISDRLGVEMLLMQLMLTRN